MLSVKFYYASDRVLLRVRIQTLLWGSCISIEPVFENVTTFKILIHADISGRFFLIHPVGESLVLLFGQRRPLYLLVIFLQVGAVRLGPGAEHDQAVAFFSVSRFEHS